MSEILKDNWFVVVIAIVIIGFVGYFVIDTNKDNVSKMTDGKQEVVAHTSLGNITADALYNELEPFDQSILFNVYKKMVVSASIETTDKIEEDAKELETTIINNAKSNSDNYKIELASELANYGYNGFDSLSDYTINSLKQKQMNQDYVDKHWDEVKKAVVDKKARTISIISMSVSDPENLSEDEQDKKDNIEKALTNGSFADAAKAFSEDTSTASNKGFFGYVDSDDATTSTSLPAEVVEAALALNKGETSDWIQATNSSTYTTSLYRVYVDETDIDTIRESENETVQDTLLGSILSSNEGLEVTILENAAKKLDIEFKNKDVQKQIEDYIADQKGGNEDETK